MNKLICKHCKTELTPDNIKDIKFGRVYEMAGFGEMVRDVAYIECSKCGSITETDNETGQLFHFNIVNARQIELSSNSNKLYDFKGIKDLLDNLSDSDKEKIKDYQFKVFEQSPDDDSGDVYDYITIFKDDTEIGKIDMVYHSNQWFNTITGEFETLDQEGYYSYTMKLNEQHNCNRILQELEIYKYLAKEQKQQLEEYTFTNENKEDTFFDNYTVWEYTADIIKDKNKIGKLNVTCGNKYGDIISLMSGIAPEYEYTVKMEM